MWPDEAGCAASAANLARCPALRDAFLTLEGPLGAGKTTFVRHLLRALGVAGRIKSPTYAVLEPHEAGGLHIAHLDFYRFSDPREWEEAGLRDVFTQPGLKLAEWDAQAPQESHPARRVLAHALSLRGLELLEALEPAPRPEAADGG